MKFVIISSVVLLASTAAMAQNRNNQPYGPPSNGVVIHYGGSGNGNGNVNNNNNFPKPQQQQYQLPKPVAECIATLKPVLQASDYDLEWKCRAENVQKDAKKNLDEISACVQTARPVVRYFSATNCLEESYRNKISNKDYTNCLPKLKNTPFEFNDDQFCNDPELQKLAGDSSLISCTSYFEKELKVFQADSLRICKDATVRGSSVLKSYKDCHQELKKYNVNINEALTYCGQPQPKVADGLGRIKGCISEMSKIFGTMKGMEVCARNLNLPEIASKENIACMNDTLRSSSPSYIDLLQGSEAAQFMRDLTIDCRKPSTSFSNNSLRYLNTYFIGSQEKVNNQEIGGLSGLAFDAKTSRLLAVSDQRFQGKNYIFKFELKDIGQGFDVNPEDKFMVIKPEFDDGKYLNRFDIDAEGIVLEANGNVIVSSESLTNNDRSYIKVFSSAGKQIEAIELPQKFYNFKLETKTEKVYQNNNNFNNNDNFGNDGYNYNNNNNYPTSSCWGNCPNKGSFGNNYNLQNSNGGRQNNNNNNNQQDDFQEKVETRTYVQRTFLNDQGITENKGFEALGMTRDGKSLFTANEAPLRQDRAKQGSFVRILKLERAPTFKPVAEYLYALDDTVDNGLVDILPVSGTEILTLERSFDPQLRKITARIYKVNTANGVDTLANNSIFEKGFKIQPLKKTLVLDLDSVIESMPAGLRKLDNLEGMAIGPKTAQGNDTLLIVSDNNMSTKQRTLLMSFEILK